MRKSVLFLLIVATVVGCNRSEKFAQELQTVDSLQIYLGSLEARMDSLDGEKIEDGAQKINKIYPYLLENFPDSLNRTFWIRDVNAMRRISKAFNLYVEKAPDLEKEIELTKEQLETLENSLVDEKLNNQKAEEYVEVESKAVNEVKFAVLKIQPEIKLTMNIWDTLYPRMFELADSLDQRR